MLVGKMNTVFKPGTEQVLQWKVQNDLFVIKHQYCVSGKALTADLFFLIHTLPLFCNSLLCELSFQGAILTTMLVSRNFSGK